MVLVKRLGVIHKRINKIHAWQDYETRIGGSAWITNTFRVIGASPRRPNVQLPEGEEMIQIPLPWNHSAATLVSYVTWYSRRQARRQARASACRRL
jgi:hypothetical protein